MLVWLLNDEYVRVTFECHQRLMAKHIMEFLVVAVEVGTPSFPQASAPLGPLVAATLVHIAEPIGEGVEAEIGSLDSDSGYLSESGYSFEGLHDDEYIPEIASGGRPRYILLASHPITSLVEVSCFYQQLDLDAIQINYSLKVGLADDYNTDRGVEFRVGHRLRSRDAVHMAVNDARNPCGVSDYTGKYTRSQTLGLDINHDSGLDYLDDPWFKICNTWPRDLMNKATSSVELGAAIRVTPGVHA
ncbi:hypothetical protein PIB30_093519 [Stylosanthes scabra]|uniref:Uncharacterized protein n=1 Tax=Stylosanthes scabra TaxID=79078 RepID=A0ABU6WTF8_9FABA|nr:hypothetical protein [Stylosanthes scabra]